MLFKAKESGNYASPCISLISFFILLIKTKRPSTLTGRDVRLSNLLISSSCFVCQEAYEGVVCVTINYLSYIKILNISILTNDCI